MSSDEEALRSVNRSFYGAIEGADVEAMRRLWSPEQVITCVHPRCQIITGWDEVLESWRILFDEIAPWRVSVEERRLSVSGDLGCVICIERYELSAAAGAADEEEGAGGGGVLLPGPGERGGPGAGAEEEAGQAGEEEEEEEDDGIRLVVATHFFFREEGQWRLAHRHASSYTDESTGSDVVLN